MPRVTDLDSWARLATLIPPTDALTRIQANLASMGVIGALFATMAFSAFLNPPNFNSFAPTAHWTQKDTLVQFYGVSMGVGLVLIIAGVVCVTLMYMMMQQLREEQTIQFVTSAKFFVCDAVIVFCFMAGTASMLLGLCVAAKMLYSSPTFEVVSVGCAVGEIALNAFFLYVQRTIFVAMVKTEDHKKKDEVSSDGE